MGILILIGSFLFLAFLGVPVAYALGLSAIAAAWWFGIPLEAVMLKINMTPVHVYYDEMSPPGSPTEPTHPPEGFGGVVILTTGEIENTVLLRSDWQMTLEPDVDPSLAETPPYDLPADFGKCLECSGN